MLYRKVSFYTVVMTFKNIAQIKIGQIEHFYIAHDYTTSGHTDL